MDKKRPKKSAGRRIAPIETNVPTLVHQGSWKHRSSSVLWLKLNFTIKTARLQSHKRQKYQHLQEEALLKARGLLQNWEDGPVLLTEDLYSRARTENEAQELLNYTPEALALRFSLRNHPEIVNAVKQLWSVDLPRDELGCIDQRGYACLFRRIGRSLEPEATKRRRRRMEKTIQEDWNRDNKGESTMSFASFFDSVFELADLWCETIDADEYVTFLRTLVLRISTLRRVKNDPNNAIRRLLRPVKQVKAIDDEQSSSSEELSPSEVDDEEEFSSESSSEEDDLQVRLPPALTPSHSLGFIATKALQTLRAKTPESERPRSCERRASIITLGDFVFEGLGSLKGVLADEKEITLKTPAGSRVSSAKSRVSSAKRNPLTIVHELTSGDNTIKDEREVNALVALQRLRSAQPQTPLLMDDVGPSVVIPDSKLSLNESLSTTKNPQLKQRPPKNYSGAFGAAKSENGVGNVQMDGLLPYKGTQNAANSAPHLKTATGLTSSTFDSAKAARVESGARTLKFTLSSTNTKLTNEMKPTGIAFEGVDQSKGNHKRLAALATKSTSSVVQNSNQSATRRQIVFPEGNFVEEERWSMDTQIAIPAAKEYVSGFGFDIPTLDVGGISEKTGIVPSNISLPFYTFDENTSPTKRLLPPVLNENASRGLQTHPETLDLSESYKKTAFLTGSLQAQAGRRASGSHNTPKRLVPQNATPLWVAKPGNNSRCKSRKQSPKRIRQLSRDDGYGDGTVSPWEAEFDDGDDLAKAFPHAVKEREKQENLSLSTAFISSAIDRLTLSISSSMVPSEPPSCVSELTTLPQEYHELVLGGLALTTYKSLSRTETAPVPIASVLDMEKSSVRESQWMLHGASQPSLTLLDDGIEGRTVGKSTTSPRSISTALISKRSRREEDLEEEELCPRFLEHLEAHGERPTTALSPQYRTDKPNSSEVTQDESCSLNVNSNDNRQEDGERLLMMEKAVNFQTQDVTVIVNATRGLVLRPGTMDELAVKRARYNQHATRSEMMRRRCQFTFGKHLS